MIIIFSFLDDLLNHCRGPGMFHIWSLVQMASVSFRFQGFQPIFSSILLWGWERCWRSCQRPRFGICGMCGKAKRNRDPVEDPPWIMLDVCVGTGMNLNVTCFPMFVYVYIYIYIICAYDDRYKCCSSYKCSFQLAIATQSSRCRSHPILTGNPLWMPSSSYTANLHELRHPRIHWFQYCGTSIVLRIS